MITRCPHCATAFRVTEALLAACSGQVRCGHCRLVFNGRAALLEPAAAGLQIGPRAEPSYPAATEPAKQFAAMPQDQTQTKAQNEPSAPEVEVIPPAEIAADPLHRNDAAAGETPVAHADRPQAPAWQPSPARTSGTIAGPGAAPAAAFDFGAVRPPSRRWMWWPASAVLLILLLAQAVLYFRGEVALLFPETKIWLTKICGELGCSVPLPRRAELMSIETSDLQADTTNPNTMVLTATLRNRAVFLQAYPALELTLTNTEDQPVARRILTARDYLPRGAALDQGFAPGAEVPVKVFIEAAELKATGYRLYLFYP